MNAIVLAGGRGLRMAGIEKAFLRLGGETFLDRVLRLLAPLFDSLIVSASGAGPYARAGARVVRDVREGGGPLVGLFSALEASDSDLNFVTAVDAPLLQETLVLYLRENASGCDALVPRSRKGVEPLCAVYSRRCLPSMRRVLDQGRVVAFYPLVRVRFVEEAVVGRLDPQGLSFLNVNTPEDYEAVRGASGLG